MLFLSSCPSKQWVSDCHNINPRLLPSILLDEPVTTTAPRRVALRNDSASDSNKILWLWFWSSSCVELPRLRISYRTHTNWSNREASASTGFREVDGLWRGSSGDRRPKNEDLPGARPRSYCPQNFSAAFVFVVHTHTHTLNQTGRPKALPPPKKHKKKYIRGSNIKCDVGSAAHKVEFKAPAHLLHALFLSAIYPSFSLHDTPSLSTLKFWTFLLRKKKETKMERKHSSEG